MTYKTWKRKDQRRRAQERLIFWRNVRLSEASRAFENWKAINIPMLKEKFTSEHL